MPIAIDQHIHRRLEGDEGEWFAKVLHQAERGLEGRSQGVYLFTPHGELLAFRNTANADSVKRLLTRALARFEADAEIEKPAAEIGSAQYWHEPPAGGLVAAVTTKLLGGYETDNSPRAKAYQESLGEDHLWIRKDEARQLAAGTLADSLLRRIARYHLVDNTRGEPPRWRAHEVRRLQVELRNGRMRGSVHLETDSGDRGYKADLLGFVEVDAGKVSRFDVVAKGQYWGSGRFTRFAAPPGKFPVAVTFRLIEVASAADRVLPGAARGNLGNYLQ